MMKSKKIPCKKWPKKFVKTACLIAVSIVLQSCGPRSTTGLSNEEKLKAGYGEQANLDLSFSSINPASGPSTGGTLVSIRGTGFLPGLRIFIGDVECTGVELLTETRARCTTGANDLGTVAVAVRNISPREGGSPETITKANQYTYSDVLPAVSTHSVGTGSNILTGSGLRMHVSTGEVQSPRQTLNGGGVSIQGGTVAIQLDRSLQ
jgi:hypothetical protein